MLLDSIFLKHNVRNMYLKIWFAKETDCFVKIIISSFNLIYFLYIGIFLANCKGSDSGYKSTCCPLQYNFMFVSCSQQSLK